MYGRLDQEIAEVRVGFETRRTFTICSCEVQCQVTLEQPSFISQKKVEEAKRVPASINERV